ncbi:hypothetical protein CTEN210_11103 [Chaetoceros tenuissimus]|uniref:NAD-dependent epimerase/dehydratase domain-containing protein n=1 Tax=Chaetoceros tenuissimus TaxID=426638 RepID=A0AAD3CYL5_9STRA|nr:hypothetical protein CTEN210_11103 [Chaetoceros tenuissimus]
MRLSSSKNDLLVIGNGNVGKEVIGYLLDDECPIDSFQKLYCTYRNHPPSGADCHEGVDYIDFQSIPDMITGCSHMVITVPPQILSESSYTDVILDNIEIMNRLPKNITIGYVSTTGVYGDHNNAWVDETSETLCDEKSKAYCYLDIENRWKMHSEKKIFIFRCAGLYGNEFSALHTVWKQGGYPKRKDDSNITPAKKEDSVKENFTSRIHLRDVARSICTSITNPCLRGGIYNLADSMPAQRGEVMEFAANLFEKMKIEIPSKSNVNEKKTSERRSRRQKDRKRVSNKKLLSLLENDERKGITMTFAAWKKFSPFLLYGIHEIKTV